MYLLNVPPKPETSGRIEAMNYVGSSFSQCALSVTRAGTQDLYSGSYSAIPLARALNTTLPADKSANAQSSDLDLLRVIDLNQWWLYSMTSLPYHNLRLQ